jgi:hypothetical protein
MSQNQGYDQSEINALREEMAATGNFFVYKNDYEPDETFAEFLFIGEHEGKPVIYDCMLYLLSMAYENKLLEMAEEQAREHNPAWGKYLDSGDEDSYPEELEDFIAYALVDLEEDNAVMVKEEVLFDFDFEYGIGLEVSLNRELITPDEINRFVTSFNNGSLKLDPTLYSFESEDDEDEDH